LSLKGKRVLITGGSGFIGSHLCRRVLDEGAELFVTVKYNSVVDNVRLVGIWNKITPIEADFRNPDSLKQLGQIQPEIIFHLAAYNHVGDSFLHVSEAVDSNGKGTVNLLEAYEDYQRFVYISSSEVYGYQETIPFREDAPLYPLSPYAVGKYMGEVYALMKRQSAGKPIAVVRPFNAYGPYQSARAVTAELIIKCIRGDDVITTEGLQTREFNFVKDLIDGMVLASTSPDAVGQVINLGCGEEISIRDLVTRIHTLSDSSSRLRIGELPQRIGDIQRMVADNTKAKDLLGWSPKVDHEQGLLTTIEWFRRYLAQFDDTNSPIAQLGA
jgi:nucleoside-diphosphate-sugar epimerase